jgi:hypothetical protein
MICTVSVKAPLWMDRNSREHDPLLIAVRYKSENAEALDNPTNPSLVTQVNHKWLDHERFEAEPVTLFLLLTQYKSRTTWEECFHQHSCVLNKVERSCSFWGRAHLTDNVAKTQDPIIENRRCRRRGVP